MLRVLGGWLGRGGDVSRMEEEGRVGIWDLGFAWRSPDDLAKMVEFNFFTV